MTEFNAKEATEKLREFMNTYPNQIGYEKYSEEMFILDVLYGLGIAVNTEKYELSNGFKKFKEHLIEEGLV